MSGLVGLSNAHFDVLALFGGWGKGGVGAVVFVR